MCGTSSTRMTSTTNRHRPAKIEVSRWFAAFPLSLSHTHKHTFWIFCFILFFFVIHTISPLWLPRRCLAFRYSTPYLSHSVRFVLLFLHVIFSRSNQTICSWNRVTILCFLLFFIPPLFLVFFLSLSSHEVSFFITLLYSK